jgi:hypothetical protein
MLDSLLQTAKERFEFLIPLMAAGDVPGLLKDGEEAVGVTRVFRHPIQLTGAIQIATPGLLLLKVLQRADEVLAQLDQAGVLRILLQALIQNADGALEIAPRLQLACSG